VGILRLRLKFNKNFDQATLIDKSFFITGMVSLPNESTVHAKSPRASSETTFSLAKNLALAPY